MVIDFLRNIKKIYRQYKEQQESSQYLLELDSEIENIFGKMLGRPTYHIGTALILAKQYNIAFDIGTCYGDCRAYIHKIDWHNDIHPSVNSAEFGSFYHDEPHEEIISIYGISPDIKIAICKCLLYAHKAGVITPKDSK